MPRTGKAQATGVNAKVAVSIILLIVAFGAVSCFIYIGQAQTPLPQVAVQNGVTTSLGTYTQNWLITYSDGSQYQDGPSQPQLLYQAIVRLAGVTPALPTYDPTRFWTVDVKIPITYTGGLSVGFCGTGAGAWWNSAIITGTASILIENLYTTINGEVQYNGSPINLGTVNALGAGWDPCSPNPPAPGVSTQQLEFWITNTQNYNRYPSGFVFNLQAALQSLNLSFLSSFTLSVVMEETVTTLYNSCTGSPSLTGTCGQNIVGQNSGSLKYGVAWSPPSGLTGQSTTTYVAPTQTFSCQGSSCVLTATMTQTITQMSSVYTFGTVTVTVVQRGSTWTTGIAVTVGQCNGAPCNTGNSTTFSLWIVILVAVVLCVAAVAEAVHLRSTAESASMQQGRRR